MQQGFRQDDREKKKRVIYRLVNEYWAGFLGLNHFFSIFFVSFSLEAKGGSFSPRLFCAASTVDPILQMECPAQVTPKRGLPFPYKYATL